MKELNVYDTLIQNEALVNELKGNLFEFLVGKELAIKNQLEGDFFKSIPREFHDRLRGYEDWLRQHNHEVLECLPALAQNTANFVEENMPGKVDGVLVVGKLAGGSHDERVKEADLLLKQNGKIVPLSLKLCKEHSFVNTKSGGVRSFFTKYFGARFPGARANQEFINLKLDEYYKDVASKLHSMAGLEEQFSFGAVWKEAGLPDLPGQLDPKMNAVLKDYYHRMIQHFYEAWGELYNEDEKKFLDCMMPLMGFGNADLGQVSCFYKGNYELSSNSLKLAGPYRSKLKNAVLHSPKDGLSFFEMEMDDCSFQLRLKPMNKFTVSGLKVNCSLKQHKKCYN